LTHIRPDRTRLSAESFGVPIVSARKLCHAVMVGDGTMSMNCVIFAPGKISLAMWETSSAAWEFSPPSTASLLSYLLFESIVIEQVAFEFNTNSRKNV
jgi:hypothetical protein